MPSYTFYYHYFSDKRNQRSEQITCLGQKDGVGDSKGPGTHHSGLLDQAGGRLVQRGRYRNSKAQWSEPQADSPRDTPGAAALEAQLWCSCPVTSLIGGVRIQSHGGKIRSYLQFMHYIKIREASNGF